MINRSISARELYCSLRKEIIEQKEYLPPINYSWSHNIHTIFNKLSKEFGCKSYYDERVKNSKKKTVGYLDCTWFYNDDITDVKLVLEYEDNMHANITTPQGKRKEPRPVSDIRKLCQRNEKSILRVFFYFKYNQDKGDISQWTFKDKALYEKNVLNDWEWLHTKIIELNGTPLLKGKMEWLIITFGIVGLNKQESMARTIFTGEIFRVPEKKSIRLKPFQIDAYYLLD